MLACNILAYSAVVHGASKVIAMQRGDLTQRIAEISKAMSREKALRDQVERGAQTALEDNERFLKELGADLHDGPTQLIGLALLKLDLDEGATGYADLRYARDALIQAMKQVRAITAGLLLPDIKGQRLEHCIQEAIRNHEARTGTSVILKSAKLADDYHEQIKICVCRFIQEGLANAARHASGVGQRLDVEGGITLFALLFLTMVRVCRIIIASRMENILA